MKLRKNSSANYGEVQLTLNKVSTSYPLYPSCNETVSNCACYAFMSKLTSGDVIKIRKTIQFCVQLTKQLHKQDSCCIKPLLVY